jgi:predicted permease
MKRSALRDLDDELEFHLDETVEALVRSGWSRGAAKIEAERRLGGRRRYRRRLFVEYCHTKWSHAMRGLLSMELRLAIRSLRATPIITAAAVASLAFGIGANAALFSIFNGLMLRPLPVPEPDRLVLVEPGSWTHPIWEEVRARRTSLFADAVAWSNEDFDVSETGEVDRIHGAFVSGTFFTALGVRAQAGRLLSEQDDARAGLANGAVAIISDGFWARRYGRAIAAVGGHLTINRVPVTIVGVAPRGFTGAEVGRSADVYLPIAARTLMPGDAAILDARNRWWLNIMARLRPGQTGEEAESLLNSVRPTIRLATLPLSGQERYLQDPFTVESASSGRATLRRRFERPLTILLSAVVLVLTIACANIANLMLAKASARRGEMELRLALGASKTRLVRQLLVEAAVLTAIGATAALLVAQWGSALILGQLTTADDVIALNSAIDWRVLAFTALAAGLTTALFGLAPASSLRGVKPSQVLGVAGGPGGSRRGAALRHGMVVAQVALSLVLVAGAVLLGGTLHRLTASPLGFTPEGLVVINVESPALTDSSQLRMVLIDQLAAAVRSTPGVRRASASYLTPLSDSGWNNRVSSPLRDDLPPNRRITFQNAVEPGWFGTYSMHLIAGRDIGPGDVRGTERIAVVNQAFVQRFLPASNPLGERITLGRAPDEERYVIVGVVNDAVYRNVRAGVVPTLYSALAQTTDADERIALTIAADAPGNTLVPALTDALQRTGIQLSFEVRDYQAQVAATTAQERLLAMLSGFFAVVSLLMAAIGLYGVTSHAVTVQRPELAVRIALGANGSRIVRLVLRRVGTLLAIGVAAGLALGVSLTSFIRSLLFELDSRDPLSFLLAALTLVAVGAVAGWLPAIRAARLDPNLVLRRQ